MTAEPIRLHLTLSRSRLAERGFTMLGTGSYVLLLNLIYATHISPQFSYLGYRLEPAGWGYLTLAWLAAWLRSLWMPIRLSRPSQVVYWILYVLVYVPSTFMPFLSLTRSPESLLLLLGALFTLFAALGLIYRLPYLRLARLRLDPAAYWGTLALLTAMLVGLVIANFGLRLEVPGLFEVYDVRSDFKEASAGALARYSVSWLGNVLFPLLVGVGFLRRRPSMLALGLLGQLFIYSTTGFKSVLFSAVLMVAVLMALVNRGRVFGLFVSWGTTLLVAGTWLLDVAMRTPAFSSLFVRRLILTPGILTGWYYDFFSDNPKVSLAHSIFEGLIPYPYDRLPPLLIGRDYFGREDTYANANLWADAYANFGLSGMAVFTLVLALVLWLFDALVKDRGFRQTALATLLLGSSAITLSNSALLTSLMTHGVALAWIVLFFLPRKALMRPSRRRSALPRLRILARSYRES